MADAVMPIFGVGMLFVAFLIGYRGGVDSVEIAAVEANAACYQQVDKTDRTRFDWLCDGVEP